MATVDPEKADPATSAVAGTETAAALDRGPYEIIQGRLAAQADDLRQRIQRLNEARREVFGAIPTQLLATGRVATANNCTPRDVTAIGDRFILGFNVHLGLKSETALADVFAIHELRDQTFVEQPLELLQVQTFLHDFREIYKYYRNAQFLRFLSAPPYLYFLFQTGKSSKDIKAFKWILRESRLEYIDNRSEHDLRLPPQHDFQWTRTHRDLQRSGRHPHISINDVIFVETVGGDLTIKVEDNTEDGQGIYREPVEDPDQTLDDAEIFYALVGNIVLLRIRPFRETAWRFLAFNRRTQTVQRIDTIGQACVLLPEDHGLIFTNGYFLQTGEFRTFESQLTDLQFERRIAASNGEDHLYVFYSPSTGQFVLLAYNMIQQQAQPPMQCHGYTFFPNGQLVVFRSDGQPQKYHALQVWQTPFVAEGLNPAVKTDTPLYRIGNRDIVRGLADCQEILTLCAKGDAWEGLYVELVRRTTNLLDAHHWLGEAAAMEPAVALRQIRETAQAAIAEFEKVTRVRARNRQQFEETRQAVQTTLRQAAAAQLASIDEHVAVLAALRQARGQLISLKELKYIELPAVELLEKKVIDQTASQSHACIEFLAQPAALQPWHQRMETHRAAIPAVKTGKEGRVLDETLVKESTDLQMLIEIVSNLKIDDTLRRTSIIDSVSAIYSDINQARATLRNRVRELQSVEGAAEFASQIKLLGQAVINYLDVCDSPQKCDELLTKMMVQVEEVEGRFAEFDEFVVQLAEKREEIRSAFDARKLQLSDARNRRAAALMTAAERILAGLRNRVQSLESVDAINSLFASDLMIEKVRDLIGQLKGLEESVKVDDLQSRLKTIREDAVRQLHDRKELFVDGQNVIRLGQHQFSVNTSPLDLTTLVRDGHLCFHLASTRFFERIESNELAQYQDLWDQSLVSENSSVYRGEYLAWLMFASLRTGGRLAGLVAKPAATTAAGQAAEDPLLIAIREFMSPRYLEGYVKGVHDHDAALILGRLLGMDREIGLLRYDPMVRALVLMFRHSQPFESHCAGVAEQVRWLVQARDIFGHESGRPRLEERLKKGLADFQSKHMPAVKADAAAASQMLFEEIATSGRHADHRALQLARQFRATLEQGGHAEGFETAMQHAVMQTRFEIATDWLIAWLYGTSRERELAAFNADGQAGAEPPTGEAFNVTKPLASAGGHASGLPPLVVEAAALFAAGLPLDDVTPLKGEVAVTMVGMLGDHPRLRGVALQSSTPEAAAGSASGLAGPQSVATAGGETARGYRLDFVEFGQRLAAYCDQQVPRFGKFHALKSQLIAKFREELRLGELQAKVLTSFVRNRLVNDIYLPLIGANFAKQIGTAGEQKRTDLMGMLLLISPPGYGKTTLMEYVANRLGITFVKINGPAIGHRTTSLDPADAANAAAREEINRLNLALEMGDNVMIYVDDIQHCDPEFLQKFISLCDATRKIEGVWRGQSRTYDLRGRKVCVVMAGNPYTESGEKFRIPDMLASRADTYNLGDVIGQNREVFELSYLENAVTSSPVLQRLASGPRNDLYTLIQIAAGDDSAGTTLEGTFAADELGEITSVLKKLVRIRSVLLQVNRLYIDSAAQAEAYRTEPPFRLQGSYRDMNKLAERVLPIMNDAEVEQLILDHYTNQAQTLATGAETSLLRFRELLGILTPAEAERWDAIKRTFRRNLVLGAAGNDNAAAQVIAQIASLGDGLGEIRKAVESGMGRWVTQTEKSATDPLRQLTLTSLGGAATELTKCNAALEQIRTALGTLADAAALRAATPAPIEVKNSVPPVFLEIIRYQHQTIEKWLDPLSKMGESLPPAKELAKTARKVSRNYKKIIDQLEASETPPSETSGPPAAE